jgi:hypothetical protein
MRRRAGYRPWAKCGEPWAFVRTILHDKAKWHGHGTFYLPLDHRSPRRTAVGDRACVTGCSISVYDPCPNWCDQPIAGPVLALNGTAKLARSCRARQTGNHLNVQSISADDPKRSLSGNACRDATRPNFTGSKRLSDLCWRDDGRSIGPPEIHFFRDFAVDRTDRSSKESAAPPLVRMKSNSALTRGILKRSIGTMALIQRSGTGKSGSGTTREPLRISGSAT